MSFSKKITYGILFFVIQLRAMGDQFSVARAIAQPVDEVHEMLVELQPHLQDSDRIDNPDAVRVLEHLMRADNVELNESFRNAYRYPVRGRYGEAASFEDDASLQESATVEEDDVDGNDPVLKKLATQLFPAVDSLLSLSVDVTYRHCLQLGRDERAIHVYLKNLPNEVKILVLRKLCLEPSSFLHGDMDFFNSFGGFQSEDPEIPGRLIPDENKVELTEAILSLREMDAERSGIAYVNNWWSDIEEEAGDPVRTSLMETLRHRDLGQFVSCLYGDRYREMPISHVLYAALQRGDGVIFRWLLDVMPRNYLRNLGWERIAEHLYWVHNIKW